MGPFLLGISVLIGGVEPQASSEKLQEQPSLTPVVLPRVKRRAGEFEEIEKAVLEGLRWLARHQNPDGSWSPVTSRGRCSEGASCFDPALEATHHYDVGVTALAVLAFLEAGFNHGSRARLVDPVAPDRSYVTGDVVEMGLRRLIEQQKRDGSFTEDHPFLYNEALAATALVEAYRSSQNRYWKGPAQKAVDFLQTAQRFDPAGNAWGWGYTPDGSPGDANLSVTAACLLALARAREAKLDVEAPSIVGARRFCEFVTANDGLVGYLDPKEAGATIVGPFDDRFTYHPVAMSALGACIRLETSSDVGDPVLPLSAKRMVLDLPRASEDRSSIDYLYWYYATLALGTFDGDVLGPGRKGKYWGPWKKELLTALLPLQTRDRSDCSKGGWLVSDRWGSWSGAGPLYDTAVSIRTLEILFTTGAKSSLHPLVGGPAPELRVLDDRGKEVSLSGLSGNVVLVDFLDAADPQFEFDLAARKHLVKRLAGRPFALFSVVVSPTGADRFPSSQEREGLSWYCMRVAKAKDRALTDYFVDKLPTTILLDVAGIVRWGGKPWDETIQQVDWQLAFLERKRNPK